MDSRVSRPANSCEMPGRVRRRQVERGLAEQLDVDERRAACGLDERRTPRGDGALEDLGRDSGARRATIGTVDGRLGGVVDGDGGLGSLVGPRAGGARGDGHAANANRGPRVRLGGRAEGGRTKGADRIR